MILANAGLTAAVVFLAKETHVGGDGVMRDVVTNKAVKVSAHSTRAHAWCEARRSVMW